MQRGSPSGHISAVIFPLAVGAVSAIMTLVVSITQSAVKPKSIAPIRTLLQVGPLGTSLVMWPLSAKLLPYISTGSYMLGVRPKLLPTWSASLCSLLLYLENGARRTGQY